MTCYRHPDRRAGVRCQRCDRPICPHCMNAASVGFHCPECVRTGRQKVLTSAHWVTRPVVTRVIIGLCLAGGALELALAGFRPSPGELVDIGALYGPSVDVRGEWWRIVTVGFLHANALHLGLNMVALWFLGSMLEPAVGRTRFVAIYVVALLAGSFGVLLLDPLAPTVGASGAVFGLMGAAVAGQRARGIDPWQSGIGGLLLVNLLFTFAVPGISIGGHLGGLAGGLVAGWVLLDAGARWANKAAPLVVCAMIAAACVAGSLWAAGQWPSRL